MRWALQGRFPQLLHPAAPGVPVWIRVFYVAQVIFFIAASIAAVDNMIDAIKTRRWKELNTIGLLFYLALWIELNWAGGYFAGHIH
jgi:hypothetical protein